MTQLVLSAVLKADGSGLVGQVRLSDAEMRKLKQTTAETGAEARRAAAATDADTRAKQQNTQAVQQNAHVLAFQAAQQRQAATAARDARIRYQQLGFQIQDITAQAASGTSAFMIFAQQGGQVAAAMSTAGGKIGAVARFLSGPYGAAITGAVALGGVLVSTLLAGGDAAEKQTTATKSLTDAIKDLDEVSGRTNKTEREKLNISLNVTRAKLNEEVAIRKLTKAKLEEALAEAAALKIRAQAPGPRGDVAALGLPVNDNQVAALRAQIAEQDARIAEAAKSVRGGIAKASLLNIAAATDAAAAATQRYENELSKLRKRLEDGKISRRTFDEQAAAITKARDAATASRRTSNAAQSESARLVREERRELEKLIDTATKGFWSVTNELEKLTPGIGFSRTIKDEIDQSRIDTGLGDIIQRIEDQRADIGKEANREIWADYTREGQEAINAIAGVIGGKLGRAMAGVAALLNYGGQPARPGSFMAGFQSSSLGRIFGGQAEYDPAAIRLREAGRVAIDPDIMAPGGGIGGGLPGAKKIGMPDPFEPLTKKMDKIFGVSGSFTATVGKAFGGAATGAAVNGVMGALGIKGSGTGAQIGGAIGSLTGIPGGDIIGSIAGSLIGGLFKKKPYGTANVTSVDGEASVTGNKGSARNVASGLAGGVQQGVQQIADMLGGDVGNFNVSIGTYKGKYRVDTGGRTGKLNFKGDTRNLHDFGKDGEAEALAFAIRDAVADGGVTGLSSAVQQALKSNTDIDKAVKEALKVQEVETAIGGIGAALTRQFSDFERQAAERTRIAKKYGFDLVKIEELNAKERTKLTDQLLKGQIGSLQQLLDDMRGGSLFEGSVADRRSALLAQIDIARRDAASGVDGAADKLAGLQRQLLDATREGYGTAGGIYAGDRARVMADAQSVIDKVTADARSAQDNALKAQMDEANNLAAVTNGKIDVSNRLLAGMPADIAAIIAQRFGGIVGVTPYPTVRP